MRYPAKEKEKNIALIYKLTKKKWNFCTSNQAMVIRHCPSTIVTSIDSVDWSSAADPSRSRLADCAWVRWSWDDHRRCHRKCPVTIHGWRPSEIANIPLEACGFKFIILLLSRKLPFFYIFWAQWNNKRIFSKYKLGNIYFDYIFTLSLSIIGVSPPFSRFLCSSLRRSAFRHFARLFWNQTCKNIENLLSH